jgi:hypothetical protein
MTEADPWTIHYTELPPAQPGSELAVEWETYRREVARLLAEGHEGKFVLIKGERILGLWDTWDAALAEAVRHFLMQPCLAHQILTYERMIRGPISIRPSPANYFFSGINSRHTSRSRPRTYSSPCARTGAAQHG